MSTYVHTDVLSTEKYQAPCWVNPVLQKKLCSTPTSTKKIYEIGKDLWEASGGLELGFEEFKKYVKKPEVSFLSPEIQIRDIWKSYFPPDTICNSFTHHDPKPSITTLKCAHCEKLTYKRKVCVECSDAAKIVVKVIEFVL